MPISTGNKQQLRGDMLSAMTDMAVPTQKPQFVPPLRRKPTRGLSGGRKGPGGGRARSPPAGISGSQYSHLQRTNSQQAFLAQDTTAVTSTPSSPQRAGITTTTTTAQADANGKMSSVAMTPSQLQQVTVTKLEPPIRSSRTRSPIRRCRSQEVSEEPRAAAPAAAAAGPSLQRQSTNTTAVAPTIRIPRRSRSQEYTPPNLARMQAASQQGKSRPRRQLSRGLNRSNHSNAGGGVNNSGGPTLEDKKARLARLAKERAEFDRQYEERSKHITGGGVNSSHHHKKKEPAGGLILSMSGHSSARSTEHRGSFDTPASELYDSVATFCYDGDDLTDHNEDEPAGVPAAAAAAAPPAFEKPSLERNTTLEELALRAHLSTNNNNPHHHHQEPEEDEGPLEMEIAPGHYVPFRGANHVWKAICEGTQLNTMCFECCQELVSVPDCLHVVCPDDQCRMVNPVFDGPSNAFGAALGIKKSHVDAQQQQQRGQSSRRGYY